MSDSTQILLQKAPDLSEVATKEETNKQKWESLAAKTAWKQIGENFNLV